MAPGCPERFDLAFLLWVARYRKDRGEAMLRVVDLAPANVETITLGTSQEIDRFLASEL